jgi:hypothetical protein
MGLPAEMQTEKNLDRVGRSTKPLNNLPGRRCPEQPRMACAV